MDEATVLATEVRDPAVTDPASERFLRFARSGDKEVLNLLLAEHLDRAFAQARRLLGTTAEAEDAVQEALLLLIRTASRYDGSVPFVAWLGCLVHSASLSALRSRGRRRRRHNHASFLGDTPMPPPSEADAGRAGLVRSLVQELPEHYRKIVDLHYFAELSQHDVAISLGISENAVAKRLQRARECLRDLLLRRGVALSVGAIGLALVATPTYAASPALIARCAAVVAKTRYIGSLAVSTGVAKIVLLMLGSLLLVGWKILSPAASPESPAQFPTAAEVTDELTEHLAFKKTEPLVLRWNFEKGPPDDLVPAQGHWRWRPASADCFAGMVQDSVDDADPVTLEFAQTFERPVTVTVIAEEWAEGITQTTISWVLDEQTLRDSMEHWGPREMPRTGGPHKIFVHRYYATETTVVGLLQDHVVGFIVTPRTTGQRHLLFSFRGHLAIQSIELREVDDSEIPEAYRNPRVLIGREGLVPMNAAASEHGSVDFPLF